MNSEHYQDPTAETAIDSVRKRVFSATSDCRDVVRISRDKAVPISEMTMDEVKIHLQTCAQSHGDPLKCLECRGGCAFGTRAIDLLDRETRAKSPKQIGAEKGAQTMKERAKLDYINAIESGDPIKYIIDHSKFSGDEVAARYAANAKLRRWKEKYGSLPVKVPERKEEEPHLMQMPCLSKKVAAEKAAQEAKDRSISCVFVEKLNALRDQMASIQKQIDELVSNRDLIQNQISQIEATASMLDVAI